MNLEENYLTKEKISEILKKINVALIKPTKIKIENEKLNAYLKEPIKSNKEILEFDFKTIKLFSKHLQINELKKWLEAS